MPIRKPDKVIGFKYVGTSPVIIIGLGELNPNDVVPVDKAKNFFGEDFNGSLLLVPVSEPENVEQPQGGES